MPVFFPFHSTTENSLASDHLYGVLINVGALGVEDGGPTNSRRTKAKNAAPLAIFVFAPQHRIIVPNKPKTAGGKSRAQQHRAAYIQHSAVSIS